ncbi:MAG TPA: acyl--CoA ligase [Candidatus Acidoferrales bacterium]|jgi:acyl-coenzyme A synthetase/AMP-(fatty) acid ligase|nr:acyl--CoA ligase [Candidatus Acidoferrales bacterium]
MNDSAKLDALEAYQRAYRDFRWETPEHFNFADVIDKFAEDPRRVAILWEDSEGKRARLTFADIAVQSKRIANVLAGHGIRRGDAVMLVLPRITLWQAAYIGALRLGAIVIPCTSMLREKDLIYRANHSGARAIIACVENASMIADLRKECPGVAQYFICGATRTGWISLQEYMGHATPAFKSANTKSSEPAICYYTSGTTREPKAVLHSHSYTYSHKFTGLNWLDLRPGDIHWTTSDTGWAKAAYGVLFGPWMNGVTTFMYNGRFDAARELDLLARYRITTFCAPPTEYRILIKEKLGDYSFPALRHCTGAGEPLNPEVIEVWRQHLGLTIHDGYGQTETTILAANMPAMPVKPGSMGLPFPGHDVRVINNELAEAGIDEVGEIGVRVTPERPPSLFLEYWKNAEETASVFRGEWYLTGDQATRDADGYLWFVGRADDVIISAGYRIGPFEVESALLEHPAVMESAVVASPDADRGSIVKAFIKLRPGAEPNDRLITELQEYCKRITAPYKYPREIEFVGELPKTVSGKIRRVELRQQEQSRKRPPL